MIRFLALWLVLVAVMILSFIMREERLAAKGKVPTGRMRRLWLPSDRRRAPRYRMNWTVRYERINGDKRRSGKTWDVSQTGAALVLQERLEPGMSMRLELKSDDGNVTPVNGKVMWVRPLAQKKSPGERLFLTGIHFEFLDPETKASLLKVFPDAEKRAGRGPHHA